MRRTFIGRRRELDQLDGLLGRVRRTGEGVLVSMRGRRQVGKSRLLEELIRRSGAKAVYFTASRQPADRELDAFRAAVASSPTEAAGVAAAGDLGSWEAALTLVAGEATQRDPIVIVVDELPYLIESVPAIEAILQKVWDRTLEGRAVVLVVVGSDISTMEALSTYGRPLFGRAEEIVVSPLTPKEIADMLSLEAADALDAYLILGGFPRLAGRWERGDDRWTFLRRELADPESSLVVLGERIINAEFPADLKARRVVEAIGSGERTFESIARRAGVSRGTLESSSSTLVETKRLVVKELPYSTTPRPKLSRYVVADPYLRFWLRFLGAQLPTLQRGRSDVVVAGIRRAWRDYRGHAIEPIVRRGIELLLPDARFGEAGFVGGYWNRDNSVEVDLVGGRAPSGTDAVDFVGSIKWRDAKPFGRADLARLTDARGDVPGATDHTLLVGVSRTGFDADGLDVELTAEGVVDAYG